VDPPATGLLAELVRNLDERFQQAALELGRAKESEVRELLRSFTGQRVPGDLLGQEEDVVLPTFAEVVAYRSPDGQVELDALAEADDGTRWVVEVKWRSKRAGRKEVEQLANQADALAARAWVIAREGFTSEALVYARQMEMMTSTAEDLARLARLVRAGA
jgi:hypothetical protein